MRKTDLVPFSASLCRKRSTDTHLCIEVPEDTYVRITYKDSPGTVAIGGDYIVIKPDGSIFGVSKATFNALYAIEN